MWSFVPASASFPLVRRRVLIRISQDCKKLLATLAPYGVTCQQAAGNRPCQMFERDVASRMSMGIIDQFELVACPPYEDRRYRVDGVIDLR
jgi:hypothetical protein